MAYSRWRLRRYTAMFRLNEFSATARLAWAAAHRGMESPLVSEYKKPFICRRLLETFLGGLRLAASEDTPSYVYCIQIALFSVVPLVTGLLVLLEHHGKVSLPQAIFVAGAFDFLYSLSLQLVAYRLRSQETEEGDVSQVNIATDEEILDFDSPLGPKTWSFLVREKKMKGGILISSLLTGVVGGCVVYYVRPSTTYHLNPPWPASLAFSLLGVVTVSVGIWPLVGGSPPEPATFHPLSWDLPTLSRPAHMMTCVLVHFIASHQLNIPWLLPVDAFFHMIFAAAPLLWLLGVLPPIDAYVLWLLEQWLVLVLGGSPMSSTRRLVAQAIFGTLTLLITAAMPSFSALMIFAAWRGFVLSVDIAWMISSLLSHRVSLLTGLSGKYEETRPVSGGLSLRRVTCQREVALVLPMLVVVVGMSFGTHLPHLAWYQQVANITVTGGDRNVTATTTSAATTATVTSARLPMRPALFQNPARDTVGAGLLLLTVAMLLVGEGQKVYLLGLIRNPFFPACRTAPQRSTCIHIYSQLLLIGCPLVSLILVHQAVAAEVHLQMAAPNETFGHFLLTIPVARVMRQKLVSGIKKKVLVQVKKFQKKQKVAQSLQLSL